MPGRQLDFPGGDIHSHGIAGRELAGEHRLCERILEALLNGTLQWTCPVDRIESGLGEQRHRGIRYVEGKVLVGEAPGEPLELNPRNRLDLGSIEGVEHHDLVDSIDELGPEMPPSRRP